MRADVREQVSGSCWTPTRSLEVPQGADPPGCARRCSTRSCASTAEDHDQAPPLDNFTENAEKRVRLWGFADGAS